MKHPFRQRMGMTLIEMVAVLVIMVILACVVVPMVSGTIDRIPEQVTQANMVQLRDSILNVYRPDTKRLPRAGASPTPSTRLKNQPQLRYLFINPDNESSLQTFDPIYKLGWRGPYFLPTGAHYRDPADIAAGIFVSDPDNPETPAQCFNRYGFITEYGLGLADGFPGDPTVKDGWGRPIILYEHVSGVWLISAGQDGYLRKGAATPLDDVDNMRLRILD